MYLIQMAIKQVGALIFGIFGLEDDCLDLTSEDAGISLRFPVTVTGDECYEAAAAMLLGFSLGSGAPGISIL